MRKKDKYMPFFEYLFGELADQDYGKLFWPESSDGTVRHNISRFFSHGEKAKEIKRRLVAILKFDPYLLSLRQYDTSLENIIIDEDFLDALTNEQLYRLCATAWRIQNTVFVLSDTLRLIIEMARSKDPRVSVFWNGICMLLGENKIPFRELKHLSEINRIEDEMKSAIEACQFIDDKSSLIKAEVLFKWTALTSKSDLFNET